MAEEAAWEGDRPDGVGRPCSDPYPYGAGLIRLIKELEEAADSAYQSVLVVHLCRLGLAQESWMAL